MKYLLFLIALFMVPLCLAENINDVIFVEVSDGVLTLEINSTGSQYIYSVDANFTSQIPLLYSYNCNCSNITNITFNCSYFEDLNISISNMSDNIYNAINNITFNVSVYANESSISDSVKQKIDDLKAWIEGTYMVKEDELSLLRESNNQLSSEAVNLQIALNASNAEFMWYRNFSEQEKVLLRDSKRLYAYLLFAVIFLMFLLIVASIKEFNVFGFGRQHP